MGAGRASGLTAGIVVAMALGLLPGGTPYAAALTRTRDQLGAHSGPAPGPGTFPTEGLAVGTPPAIPYAYASDPGFGEGNWRLLRPDGTSLRLPRLTWSTWAPTGRGAIGMAGTEAGTELQRVAADASVRTSMVRHFGLAVSPDHAIVGWLGGRGAPHLVEDAGRRDATLPVVRRGRQIVGIWGARTCREQEPEGGGCTAFVDAAGRVRLSSSHGVTGSLGRLREVADVSQHGHIAARARWLASAPHSCWGVYRASGHRIFRTCGYYLDSFAPDGRRVLAEQSEARWSSVRRFAVLDGRGAVEQSWSFHAGPRRSLSQLTWEDSHHLLGVLLAHGQWSLVRIGTDGTVEYAGPPDVETPENAEENAEESPYDLPLR
ncbi:MAG TPA: hypothetical protein VHW64_16200 [Nocardioides sp.]|uniref:hypothetical protein n=1 Tax=Nocardioides sp. TaxID=35761 RepID=UPI002E2FA7A8|nr:hypothetical protein [Nocardioides sp.]HEX3932244.1 hypothetical protein [Nocardioides sp.]